MKADNTVATNVQNLGLASYEISLLINKSQRAFNELLKTCLGHHDLTIPEWSVLGNLHASGSLRPVEIALLLGVKPPFIAKLIAKLEQDGLTICQPFPDDERGKTLTLTPAGSELVEQVEVQLQDCLQTQFGALAETDLRTYFLLNDYIAQNVKHH